MIWQLEAKFRQIDILRAIPIDINTFYYWKKKFKRIDPEVELTDLIYEIWRADCHLGVLRITAILKNRYDIKINHKKVQRIMHELNIEGQGYRKLTRKYDSSKGPEGKRVKNKINRRFKSNRPYQKMVSDVTEFKLANGNKVYLEPIMDLYNNQILTYSITSNSPNLSFALQPLIELQNILPKTGYRLTMHTDQGWQYRHRNWQKKLKELNITQSMSHRARCLDNACIESFFNKLKVEIGNLKQFDSAKELINAIKTWIEYYNTKRIQIKLGGRSPIEYQQQAA